MKILNFILSATHVLFATSGDIYIVTIFFLGRGWGALIEPVTIPVTIFPQ